MAEHSVATSHLKFGILGIGQFGSKIQSKLRDIGTTLWAVNSQSDFTSLEIPDWVFIATPNTLHYEQADYFLKAGANVFVEKPGTLDPAALEDLINLSKYEGKRFYVGDVFLYRSDLKVPAQTEYSQLFVWHKMSSSGKGSLLDRFAYHHLYLLFDAFNSEPTFEIGDCATITPNKIEFDAKVNGKEWRFSYCVSDDIEDKHTAFGIPIGQAPNDALLKMLVAVLSGSAVFEGNHRRALWVTIQLSRLKKAFYKNIGIVGGGIFGSTIAIELANQGYNVVLYERNKQLLEEASSINQYRVHNGYHYPRSRDTAQECKASSLSFIKNYKQSIVSKRVGIKHYYAIASEKSMTGPEQFIAFMDTIGLPYKRVQALPCTDLTVEVEEDIFDAANLATTVKNRLKGAGVKLMLGVAATEEDLKAFDFTVIATYANLNDWCSDKREYQYELCEKPVLMLPDSYRKKSIVVLDGPFMCIDPFGNSDLHVMGNVVHAIHHTNVGYKPIVPEGYESLLNKGVVRNPPITNIEKFIESARQFFPDIEQAQHVGSMFTIRTVLSNREKDDARPTLVEWIAGNRLMVFSGKICTCVHAAKTVLESIEERLKTNALSKLHMVSHGN